MTVGLFGLCYNNALITTPEVFCIFTLLCTGMWWQLPRSKTEQKQTFVTLLGELWAPFNLTHSATELQFYHLSDIEEELQETIQLCKIFGVVH